MATHATRTKRPIEGWCQSCGKTIVFEGDAKRHKMARLGPAFYQVLLCRKCDRPDIVEKFRPVAATWLTNFSNRRNGR